MKGSAQRGFLAAVIALALAGCTARFESFPFVTAQGQQIEIRQSPGRSRDQEAVFAPSAASLTSPLYSLGKPLAITASRQAFALSYTGTLADGRLSILSDRKTVVRSVRLPPSGSITLRYLVPLSSGDQIWGYQLSAGSPARVGESLQLKAAGTSQFVHGFEISPEGLSVDGSVEVLAAGPEGTMARITEETRKEMAQGIWQIRLDVAQPEMQSRDDAIRSTGSDAQQAVFTLDAAAAPASISFARGSTGFLPRDLQTRLPVQRLDISFVPADRPIPADPGMILGWDRATWRRSDFELYAWDRFPRVLIFDTATYDVQDGLFKRLAYFVEKAGYRDTIEDPEALAGRHGYNAHDYRAEDLARFFSEAFLRGISLTPGETDLEQILTANDLMRKTAKGFAPGEGAVISISRSSSPVLRHLLLSHESAHGEFFSLPQFRAGVEEVWESLSPVEKDVWLDYLSSKAYDSSDHYLVVNEFQAYLFQQQRQDVEGFQSLTLSRMMAQGGKAAALARRLLAERPHSFLDSFDALDAKLRAAGGPPGGHQLAILPR